MIKAGSIRKKSDIPLAIREFLEKQEILSRGETILLFFSDNSYMGLSDFSKTPRGYCVTNLRFFYIRNGKSEHNSFLNDIRHAKVERKTRYSFLTLQMVDGLIKTYQIAKKENAEFMLKFIESFLFFRLETISAMLRTDEEQIQHDIDLIIRENYNTNQTILSIGEQLWQCKAKEGETVQKMLLRILQPNSKLSGIGALWDRRMNMKSIRIRLIFWSQRLGLKIPARLLQEMEQ